MEWDFVAGDTGSKLVVTCKEQATKAVKNLTGASLKLKWKINDGTLSQPTMTITDAPNGIAEYQFASGELVAGMMEAAVEITDSGGLVTTQLTPFQFAVRAELT